MELIVPSLKPDNVSSCYRCRSRELEGMLLSGYCIDVSNPLTQLLGRKAYIAAATVAPAFASTYLLPCLVYSNDDYCLSRASMASRWKVVM